MKISHKVQKTYMIAMFLVSLLLAAAGTTAVYAKYVKDVPFSGNVTVQADLVGGFKLYESEASRTELGNYSLVTANKVIHNEYILMPGVDIPKDPQIEITGKTAVPAYLYVEVVESLPNTVEYTINSVWTEITGITGPHGGKLYVYSSNGTPLALTNSNTPTNNIDIINENKIRVSDTLVHPTTQTYSLNFFAYMAQVPNNTADSISNALEVFKVTFN